MNGERYDRYVAVSGDNPAIVKDLDLCVACGHCLAVCQEQIGVSGNTWDVPGAEAEVNCIGLRSMQCSMPGAGHNSQVGDRHGETGCE